MNIKDMPKLYTDREDYSPEDHFIFISYSHKDKDIVYNDLNKLYELGVKFWYDRGLEVGTDMWFSQVEDRIKDSRCVGVVFYLSPYVFTSSSIEREIELLKISDNQTKSYFSINIGGKNTTNIFDETAFLSEEDKNKRNSKRTKLISEFFDDDYPFVPRSKDVDNLDHIDELYEKLKKYNITSEQSIKDVELIGYDFLHYTVNSNGIKTVTFGSYPQSEVKMFSIWKKDLVAEENNVYKRGNENYEFLNEKYFHIEPIKWRVLDYQDKILYLLSDKCLDCQEYHNEPKAVYWEESSIRAWLNNYFYNIAFNDFEKNLIIKNENDYVTMPTIEELVDESRTFDSTYDITPTREVVPTDYALEKGAYSGPTGTCYWWYKIPFGNGSLSPFVYDNGGLLNYKGAFRTFVMIDLKRLKRKE